MRVIMRRTLLIQARSSFGNLLDPAQREDLIKEDLLFRDRQLKRLRDKIVDLDDRGDFRVAPISRSPNSGSTFSATSKLTEQKMEEAGDGLYAVVPSS